MKIKIVNKACMNSDVLRVSPASLKRTYDSVEPGENSKKIKTEFNFFKLELSLAATYQDPEKAAVIVRVYQKHFNEIEAIWPDFASIPFYQMAG